MSWHCGADKRSQQLHEGPRGPSVAIYPLRPPTSSNHEGPHQLTGPKNEAANMMEKIHFKTNELIRSRDMIYVRNVLTEELLIGGYV